MRARDSRWSVVVAAPLLVLAGAASGRAQQAAAGAPEPVAGGVSTLTTPAVTPLLRKPVAAITPGEVAGMQATLLDWAQLGRYRAENAKLGPPVVGQPRVIFYGDSITDAWGRVRGRFFPEQPWLNRGISGQTTEQMLVRFEQDVLDLRPAAVVILAGVNDIAGNTGPETMAVAENDLRAMVTLARANRVHVVLCSVLPATRFSWNPGVDPRAEVKALNAWIQSYAAEQGSVYLDYYTPMAAPDGSMKAGLSVDGVHPTDAGYAVMEPLARAAVAKALQPAP